MPVTAYIKTSLSSISFMQSNRSSIYTSKVL